VYPGIDAGYKEISDKTLSQTVLSKYRIDRPYILYVGTLEPRKNLVRLLESYAQLRADNKIRHKLVVSGKKGWLFTDIFETVTKLSLTNDVLFTGYVPNEDLVHIYNCADVFVYPTLYEGFGIPPLESMACGVPVISTAVSSIPEVLGDAALLVNPYETAELTEAIYSVITDEKLRRRLISKGFDRVKQYNWANVGQQIIKIYNEEVQQFS
jgi:glycosyltransferase involved in cell wall biosynthesis